MSKKLLLPGIIVILVSIKSFAQSELTMPFLDNVYQASYFNPVAVPEHKVSIGLPGISSIKFGVTNSGFTFEDLVKNRTDSSINLSISQLINRQSKKNYVYTGVNVDLFHLRVKVKNTFFSAHIREHIDARFAYSKDFAKLAWEGNAEYLDERLDLSGLGLDANHYREYAIGFLKHNERNPLTYGGRFKFLQGLSNAQWKNDEFYLETDGDMYELTLQSNGVLNTSLPYVYDEDGDSTYNTIITDEVGYLTNFENKGFAIDLGASYQIRHNIKVTAAINNIGFINWKSNATNYKLTGGTEFNGIESIEDWYNSDSLDFESYVDTLRENFDFTETNSSYKTWLPPELYLMASFQADPRTEVGASLYLTHYKTVRTAVSLMLSHKIGKWFQGVATYTYQYQNFNNFGLAFMFKPGPVQFYIAGDNLIRRLTEFEVEDDKFYAQMNSKFFNLRFGINYVFGRIRTPDRQPLPEE